MARTVFAVAGGLLLLCGFAVLSVVPGKFRCIIGPAAWAVDHVDVHLERERDLHIANWAFHSRWASLRESAAQVEHSFSSLRDSPICQPGANCRKSMIPIGRWITVKQSNEYG